MKQPAKSIVLLAVLASAVALAGCANHYIVRDPATNNVYYTNDIDRVGGSVRFRDERTGNVVTLPQSEVREISSYDYRMGVSAK